MSRPNGLFIQPCILMTDKVIDTVATDWILNRKSVHLNAIKKAYGIKPLVRINLQKAAEYADINDIKSQRILFRATIYHQRPKNEERKKLKSWIHAPEPGDSPLVLYSPPEYFDLLPFRWFGFMLGKWRLELELIFVRSYYFQENPSMKTMDKDLDNNWGPSTSYEWQVVRRKSQILPDVGQRNTTMDNIEEQQGIPVDPNDI
jgi:hypothetical protein